jgi:hypothetical protein
MDFLEEPLEKHPTNSIEAPALRRSLASSRDPGPAIPCGWRE